MKIQTNKLTNEFPLVNRRVNGYEASNFFSESIFQCKKSMDNSPEERSQQLTVLGVPNLPGI